MPTFQGLVSEEQVNALVAYIKSISTAKPGNAVEKSRTSASTAAPAVRENAQPDIQRNAQSKGSQVR
jgi:predicted naringenin-chalcone synthase